MNIKLITFLSILPLLPSCTSRQNQSTVKLSPFLASELALQNHLSVLSGKKVDLTTYIASDEELTSLNKQMRPEVYKFAEHHGRSAGGSFIMSDVELGMITAYSSNHWYKDWNKYLRTPPNKRTPDLAIEAEIKVLSTALNKHKKRSDSHTGVVFRGAGLHNKYYHPILNACKNGDLSISRAFFSTSLSEDIAKDYSKLKDDERDSGDYRSVVYHVIVKDEPSIGFDSQFETEKEVLTLANNVFQLLAVKDPTLADPYTRIYMIELDPQTGNPATETTMKLPSESIICKDFKTDANLFNFE